MDKGQSVINNVRHSKVLLQYNRNSPWLKVKDSVVIEVSGKTVGIREVPLRHSMLLVLEERNLNE